MGPAAVVKSVEKKRRRKKMKITREATEDAEYAQKRLALANKYSNAKNRAKAEAQYGEKAKETRKVKYVTKNGQVTKYERDAKRNKWNYIERTPIR